MNEKTDFLNKKDNFIILDSFYGDRFQLLLENPNYILKTYNFNEIISIFKEIDNSLKKGYIVAGFISYEAGIFFSKKIKYSNENSKDLLCYFGIYEDYKKIKLFENTHISEKLNFKNFYLNINKKKYLENINNILVNIIKGNVYQVNYTFKLHFELEENLFKVYKLLRNNFHTQYSALIRISPDNEILSFSPELFFKIKNNTITVKPMKGTGIYSEASKINSKKNAAENYMIVDLLRNDLGKVSTLGSVNVNKLLQKESYGEILQLTSEITSKVSEQFLFENLFKSIFPSGSITGAPKESAMSLIHELESNKRNVYTGSIGIFFPDGRSKFNVAIRTLVKRENKYEMGVGSGIVYDSNPEDEWRECFQKASFLFKSFNFYLFESILYKNGILYFLEEHLDRLERSSKMLYGHFEKNLVKKSITDFIQQESGYYKLKCIYKSDKTILIEKSEFIKNKFGSIHLSKIKVNSKDFFLHHKTSYRNLYDDSYKNKSTEITDIIFANEFDIITEGCISNIFVLLNGTYYTSHEYNGLLNGVYRKNLLKKFPKLFKEKDIYIDDLFKSKKIFICNSIRGIMRVKING